MSDITPRFGLPLLQAGQAQKEVLHNEAVLALELLCQPVVDGVGDDAPPAAPVAGATWIVGDAPGGAWTGHAGALATWTEGGWRFVDAVEGLGARMRSGGLPVRRRNGTWLVGDIAAARVSIGGRQVLGAQQPAVAAPAGGTVVDAQARAAIGQLLEVLRAHGLIAA